MSTEEAEIAADTGNEATVDSAIMESYLSFLRRMNSDELEAFVHKTPALSPNLLEILLNEATADPNVPVENKYFGEMFSGFIQASYDGGFNDFLLESKTTVNMARGLMADKQRPLNLTYRGSIKKKFGAECSNCKFIIHADSGIADGHSATDCSFRYSGDAYQYLAENAVDCDFEIYNANAFFALGAARCNFLIRGKLFDPCDQIKWTIGYEMPEACRFRAVDFETFRKISKIYDGPNLVEYCGRNGNGS